MPITFATMQTRVALNCNNLQSSDPVYAYLPDFVNEATNGVILLTASQDKHNVNIFPELRNRRWYDVTVNGQGYMTIPSTLLVLSSVTTTRLTSAYNQNTDPEYVVSELDSPAKFALLSKTAVGWPALWCKAANEILLSPLPSSSPTNYLTQVILRGIRKEAPMVAGADTPIMNDLWHPAVIDYATSLAMTAMGQNEGAKNYMLSCSAKIGNVLNLLGLERASNKNRVNIAGMPRGM